MAQSILFQHETHSGTEQHTTFFPDGISSVFSRLPHYDFLTFLAMAQKIPDLHLLSLHPRFEHVDVRRGASGAVHVLSISPQQGIVYKRFHITQDFSEKTAYRALICELLVLEHPVLKNHPNLQQLLGVTWDVQMFQGSLIRVMPVFIFKQSDHGTLSDFMNSSVSFTQRLRLCRDIGRAIEPMHEFSRYSVLLQAPGLIVVADIIHGDIKPENILIFSGDGGFVAKVIDFGCSCFGSREDDLVLLSRTVHWAAPEIHDTLMTVKAAKLTDIYSYGKTCAWILFGQEMSVTDFARMPFDFSEAVEKQMQTRGTGWEELLDGTTLESQLVQSLSSFFEQSFVVPTERRAHNVASLPVQLESIINKCDSLHSRRREPGDNHSHSSDSFAFRRLTYSIRHLVSRLLVLTILGRNTEMFIPGQPQLVYRFTESLSLQVVPVAVILIAAIGVMPYLGLHYKRWPGLLYVIPVVTVLLIGTYYLSWNQGWQEIRQISRSFSVYGQTQHAVPNLADIFSLLTRGHYLVREQLIKDLESRARSDCPKCQPDAAFQLALCHYTAFGTPRDIVKSEYWLQLSNRGEREFKGLCKQVDYNTIYQLHEEPLIVEGQHLSNHEGISATQKYNRNLDSAAILRYQKEIDGREESKVGLRSLELLHEDLGNAYFAHQDYELAEYHYRKAMSTDREIRHKSIRNMLKLINYDRQYNLAPRLAVVLDKQGKEKEAIQVLETRKTLRNNPNGRGTIWSFTQPSEQNRDFTARFLLVDLLIRQQELDQVVKLDLHSDLKDALKFRDKDTKVVSAILKNIAALAQSLFKQGREYEAANLLRKLQESHVGLFGRSHLKTMKVTSNFILMLSCMGAEQVDEAVQLRLPTLDDSSEDANMELLLVRIAHAFALSKKRNYNEAIAEMELVLQFKKRSWTQAEYMSHGCMSDFVGSLCFPGDRELGEPAAMQHELLAMSKCMQDPEAQESIIALLCALSRLDGLEEAVQLMRGMVKFVKLRYPDQWRNRLRLQEFLIFILSNLGLCFESRTHLEEALALANALRDEIRQVSELEEVQRVRAVRLLASVLFKKCAITCHRHGFGHQDLSLMSEVEKMHRVALNMATDAFGETHDETVHAMEKLAVTLSINGRARGDRWAIGKAGYLFSTALWLRDSMRIQDPENPNLFVVRLKSECSDHHFAQDLETIESHERAHTYLEHCLVKELGENSLAVLAQAEQLAQVRIEGGFYDTARRTLLHILSQLRKDRSRWSGHPDHHPQVIKTLAGLARMYELNGESYRSLPLLRYVIRLARKTFTSSKTHPAATVYRMLLVIGLSRSGINYAKDLESANERLNLARDAFGTQHTQTITCMEEVSEALSAQNRDPEAVPLTREALELSLSFLSVSHHTVSQLWAKLLARMHLNPNSEDLQAKVEQVLLKAVHDTQLSVDNSYFRPLVEQGQYMVLGSIILGGEHIFTTSASRAFRELLGSTYNIFDDQAVADIQQRVMSVDVSLEAIGP